MHFSGFDFEGLALDLYFVSKVLDELEFSKSLGFSNLWDSSIFY